MAKTTKRQVLNSMKNIYWQLLPPIIADNGYLWRFIKLLFRTGLHLEFRANIHRLSIYQYKAAYESTNSAAGSKTNTDMSDVQIASVSEKVIGNEVCELGCGSGALSIHVHSLGHQVTACDMASDQLTEPGIQFKAIDLMKTPLPFDSDHFETVISCFTLEHLLNSREVVKEMYRIASRRIIILVPCEAYRRFLPNYHINFYPDEAQLCLQLGVPPESEITKVQGDWLVVWDKTTFPPSSTFGLYRSP